MRYLVALILIGMATPAAAQQRLLNRADSLLIAGNYAAARAALAQWQRAYPPTASVESGNRARALYLTARLTGDARKAQDLYTTIVLSYPTARETPDALLRLGQGLLAAGDARKATGYLERLVNDYPNAPNRPQAALWLARAQAADGNAAAACKTAGAALKAGNTTAELVAPLQEEVKMACAGPQQAGPPVRQSTTPPETDRSTAAAPFSVQTAAFREASSAAATAAQLKRNGFDARVAYVGESTLARVRIGRFNTRNEATAELQKLQRAGITAIVVDDVVRERANR